MFNSLYYKYKYSMRKPRKVFNQMRDLLLKKKKKISEEAYNAIKTPLLDLKMAIIDKDRLKAHALCSQITTLSKEHLKKNLFDHLFEWVFGIGFTLLTVTIINQLWFQHYQIPSGSMRPSLLEKDRVIATKTCFGINLPFRNSHLYFNPSNLQRGNMAIFTADNIPSEENKSKYLFIFNTKKQMVKRLIGKPGDILYFYGGKIYGIDKEGREITDFQQNGSFKNLEHIPIMNFEGKVVAEDSTAHQKISSPVYLHQMGQIVAKLYTNTQGTLQGKFSNGRQWVDESPKLEYKDLWGIKNFAMARFLTRSQALELKLDLKGSTAEHFLELHHSPHTNYPRPHLGVDLYGRLRPMITPEKSVLPLQKEHIERIQKAMNTARFVVKDGYVGNYSIQSSFKPHKYSPRLENIEDGTYEFLNGVAYKVSSSGHQKKLSQNHPLNSLEPSTIQNLFNLGVQWLTLYQPSQIHKDFIPQRFVYFREGNLYLMSQQIFTKEDPLLAEFVKDEMTKSHGFFDHGCPIQNGSLNKELIMNYGLRVPKGHYLFLGDNHAQSRDCREFGFIPEKNIQGSPAFIIWPSSSRFGLVKQEHLRWFNLPNFIVWSVAALSFGASFLYTRKQRQREL